MKNIFLFLIQIYKYTISPFLGRNCRFEPSCSCYAYEAFKHHNISRALLLTACRLLRCNPFSESRFDPVPIKIKK